MIPEMVITIAYDDIECHTAIELTQVFFTSQQFCRMKSTMSK